MKPPQALLELLRSADTEAADHALGVAVEHLPRADAAPLVELLLSRGGPASYEALIERLHLLAPESQERVREVGEPLRGALVEVMRTGSSQSRGNVLELIVAAGDASLSYLAVDALMDRSGNVRQSAAKALKHMTDLYFERVERERYALLMPPEDGGAAPRGAPASLAAVEEARQTVVRTLRLAVERFPSHHHLDALEAGMYFVDELGPTLFEPPPAHRGRFNHAMLQIFAGSADPRLAPFAYAALGQAELRGGVLNTLATRRDGAFFEALVREHWRARLPGAREALSTLHTLSWLQNGIAPLLALPEELHAAGIDWLSRLGLPDDRLMELLRGALDFECGEGLVQAAWAAATRHTAEADALLGLLAAGSEAEAARIAQFEMAQRQRRSAARQRSAGSETQLQWTDFLRRNGMEDRFDSVWAAAERLIQSGTSSGGGMLMTHMASFLPSMRAKLCAAAAAERVRAHRLIAALHLESQFLGELFAGADDAAAAVRAMAVAALGRIGDATSRRILERSVKDADPHVRTNAVEALAGLGGSHTAALLTARLSDDSPAVRSCAIRVLLRQRVPAAAEALIHMLKDDQREQRLAALSLVAHMRLTAMQRRVAALAESDADEQVRQRAARLLRAWEQDSPAAAKAPVVAGAAGQA